MNSKDYVLNHDFGFCKEPELVNLNKLELRNLEDIKVYVYWSIKELFKAKINKNNIIVFKEENYKTQIRFEKIEG